MQPPEISVASRSRERSELAKALRTTLVKGYQPGDVLDLE
jgi:hypothetical protein